MLRDQIHNPGVLFIWGILIDLTFQFQCLNVLKNLKLIALLKGVLSLLCYHDNIIQHNDIGGMKWS